MIKRVDSNILIRGGGGGSDPARIETRKHGFLDRPHSHLSSLRISRGRQGSWVGVGTQEAEGVEEFNAGAEERSADRDRRARPDQLSGSRSERLVAQEVWDSAKATTGSERRSSNPQLILIRV